MKHIYFDYAATTPTDPQVVKAMEPFLFEQFGNASSPHTIGRQAASALEAARETVAKSIGAKSDEVIFNSGATEASNHVLFGLAKALKAKGNHIIISSIEHHCVLEPAQALKEEGFKITYLPADQFGFIQPDMIKKFISDQTILLVVIHASNEIGTIQSIAQIGAIAKEHKIPFFVDTVQSVGHIPVNVNSLNADFISMSAHKFYGPKGVGALYLRQGMKLPRLLLGGDQEKNRRASTQNVAGAVGMAKALELCLLNINGETQSQTVLRDRLLTEIPKIISGVKINGDLKERLPNNAHFSFERVSGESLLMSLDMAGICASMGSACTSGAIDPSHVLRAIGLDDELALGSLRLTIGRWTTNQEVDILLNVLPGIIRTLRI